MRSALTLALALVMTSLAGAQYCSAALVSSPYVAAPIIQYAPIVQLQQVVAAPAPIVQQQVQPLVQQVVTAPALPVLQYQPIYQPLVQAVVARQYQHQAAAIVVPQRFVARQFIVGNRAQRVVAVRAVRAQPVLQLNVGRRR